MNGKPQEKQPAVRPGFLIVLFIVLGAALYWNFLMQPKPAPVSPTLPAPKDTPWTNGNTSNQPEKEEFKISTGPISNRDLFLPPSLIIAARRRRDNISPSNQPVRNESVLIRPDQRLTSAIKEEENPEKPVLKGIVGTASTQVIIVRYKNKSYLLKLGEILPGTEYRVVDINSNEVKLLSPKGLLILDKKARAK